MITDALLQFSAAQASVRAAGNYVSTNTVDLGVARDIGVGEPLVITTNVDVAFAGGTSVEIQLVGATDAAITTPVVLGSTGAIPEASLTAGASFNLAVPEQAGAGYRYIAVRYVGVGTHTAGSLTSQMVLDAPNVKYFARNYVVS